MKNEPNKGSGIPLIIIGAVLVAAFIGGYWYWNYAKSKPANTNRAASTANTNANRASTAASAPLGANPPNMMGSPTASVTIEEFADFQCGACASVHPTMKEIQSTYGSKIRFIFRHFPLAIPGHEQAFEAAVATEAAGMQDRAKFWALQNLLLENQQTWSRNPNYRTLWEGYAQQIGLDVERFKADMAGEAAKKRVNDDMARGRSLNIDSTPTVFVNGKNIPLQSITAASLRQVIDSEIQNAIKTQPAANAAPSGNSAPAANANK
jgi:protein-disulfide isomerase